MINYYREGTKFSIEVHSGKTMTSNQHFHSLFEIYYLVDGEVQYFIDDTIYNLGTGDIVIIPPTTIHKTIDSAAASRKRMLIYLDKEFLKEFRSDALDFLDSVSVIHTKNNERVNEIFNELLNEYNTEGSVTLLKALSLELLVRLKRLTKNLQEGTEQSASSKRILDIISYINKDFALDITLSRTAKRFFMHPCYLSRLFHENTGISFSDYLKKYRIKKAIELMSSTDKSITEISFDVGFNSTNHFCKVFKAIMNVSPLRYKKEHIQK